MNAQELTLNIAVNLGRLGRWSLEGRVARIQQFLGETEEYLGKLARTKRNSRFESTFTAFKKHFIQLKNARSYNEEWAEHAFTWANILTHRAKLA